MSEQRAEYCRYIAAGGMAQTRPFPLPGDKPRYPRDRLADIRHIRLDISLDFERRSVSGTATHTFTPINDGLTRITFDAAEMNIQGVRTPSGKELTFDYRDGSLTVFLDRPYNTGEEGAVVIAYAATPRRGLYFIGPDEAYPNKPRQCWTQGQDEDSRYWFPCYDYPNERQSSELFVTVPASMIVISNGELVSIHDDPARGTRTFHWYQEVPHVAYLTSIVAGEFAHWSERAAGVPLLYYVPPERLEDGKRALGRTAAMMEFYSQRVAPYPYPKYAQSVVADFIFGGMENISATTLTENVLQDERALPDYQLAGDSLVAHELAHQWFGDLLTCRDWSHAWLNEGFATYFDALFTESYYGVDEFRYQLFANAESYFDEDGRRYRRPIVNNVYHEPIDIFDRHLYEKGSLVLHMLRYVLGDDLWWKTVRFYVERYRGGVVTTPDFQRAIEEATGRNLDWFFDQWLYKGGYPRFNVSWEWDDGGKLAKVTIAQTQTVDDITPVFRMPVVVDFEHADGQRTVCRFEVSEKEQTFYAALPERPKLVRFDPGNHVLKQVEFKPGKEMLLYQLERDDDVIGRIRAAQELSKIGGPDVVAALKRAVLEDPFWGVRNRAARALGAMRTESALDALIECLPMTEHPKARRGVVMALGEYRSEKAADALIALLERGDPSYYVEAEAAKSLGKTRSARAFETLLKQLDKPSHNEVIRMLTFEGFAELKDDRAIAVAQEWTAYGRPPRVRQAATAALGKLGEDKPDVTDFLTRLLTDPWLHVRLNAAIALGERKDERAIPHLERAASTDLDGRVVRFAREAIARIREGKDKGEEVKKLRADVDRLLEENKALKDRLEKIEARLSGGP
jgi:aminopeptidase N